MKKLIIILFLLSFVSDTFSQEVLIPYRKGLLWGLSDTNGTIKVIPQFHKEPLVFKENSYFYIVELNNKKGVYDIKSSRYIVPCNYEQINLVEHDFLLAISQKEEWRTNSDSGVLYTSKGDTIPKLKGQVFLNSFFVRDFKKPRHLKLIELPNKSKGLNLYLYNSNTKTFIQTIFETYNHSVDWSYHGPNGTSSTILISKENGTSIKYKLIYNIDSNKVFTTLLKPDDDMFIDDIPDSQDKKNSVEKKKLWTPDLNEKDNFYFRNENKPFSNFPIQIHKQLEKRIDWVGAVFYNFSLVNDTFSYKGYSSHKEFSKDNDKAIPCKNCILQKYKWQLYINELSYYQSDDKVRKAGFYAITTKGKKRGIITELGEVLPQFTSIEGIGGYNHEIPSFIVTLPSRKKIKTGIIDAKGNWKMTPIYDSIVPIMDKAQIGTNAILYYNAYKENKIFVFSHEYEVIDSFGFEKAFIFNDTVPEYFEKKKEYYYNRLNDFSSNFIILKRNSKYGFYFLEEYFKPKFNYPTKGFVDFGTYRVYSQYSENGKKMGYVSQSGLYYFED